MIFVMISKIGLIPLWSEIMLCMIYILRKWMLCVSSNIVSSAVVGCRLIN